MSTDELPDTLSAAQSLLKKHEAFHADLIEHQDRVKSLMQQGDALIAAANYQAEEIRAASKKLHGLIDTLTKTTDSRRIALDDSFKFLQFTREADSIEAWMGDKEPQTTSDDFGKHLPSTQSLISKHETFHASIVAFQPRVDGFSALKRDLVSQNNSHSAAVSSRELTVLARWKALIDSSDKRKVAHLCCLSLLLTVPSGQADRVSPDPRKD